LSGISLTAALPLVSFALAYAVKGGRSPQGFAVALLPLAFLPLSPAFRANWLPGDRPFRPVLILFAWCTFTLLAFPPLYPHLDRLALLAAYVVFAAAATLWTDRERRAFVALVLLLGAFEALMFIVLHLRRGEFNGHLFGNPIYSALAVAVALLSIPVFANQRRNGLLLPVAVILTVALALTRSRSTLLGFLVAAAVIAPRKRYLIGLSVLAAAAGFVAIADPSLVASYLKVDFAHPEDIFGRLTIWRSAIAASLDHPITGWGLGNFEAAYLRHQAPINMTLRFDRSTPFAHNDLLQLAVEAGWIGAGLGMWALASFVRTVRTRLNDPVIRWSAATVLLYVVAGIFNFTFFLPYNGFVAAAALGFGLRGAGRKSNAMSWMQNRFWLAVPAVVLVFAMIDGTAEMLSRRGRPEAGARLFPVRADLWYDAGMQALGDRTEGASSAAVRALKCFRSAIRWNPQDAFAWNRLAVVALAVPDSGVDADAAFSRAIDLAPMHAPFWIDAGFERLRAKDAAGAEQRFERATELEPNAPLAWFALAAAAKERGRTERAAALLEKAVAVHKEFSSVVPPSGYARYLFGMTEQQMRAALK
jgi:O-antigen ligase